MQSQVRESCEKKCRFSAVLFDVDGTICSAHDLCLDVTNETLKAHGFEPTVTLDEYQQFTIYTTPDRLAHHAKLDTNSTRFHEVGTAMANTFDNKYITMVNPDTAPLYDGILNTLAALSKSQHNEQQVAVGALTNAVVEYAHAVFECHEISNFFASVNGANSVPRPKPYPDGLIQCLDELSKKLGIEALNPSQAVYIGDSPSDGKAAKAAGMLSVGAAWGYHKVAAIEDSFDVLLHNPSDLNDFLFEHN